MTIVDVASTAIIAAACAAAAIGCFALNRRIQRLASTERGIGKAVSEMSAAVSQFKTLLGAAEQSAREATAILEEQLVEARQIVARLEPAAGVAPRAAARNMSGKAPGADPLSDVVPKGASAATGSRRDAREPAAGTTAEQRLADLIRRRSTPDPDRTRLRRAPA